MRLCEAFQVLARGRRTSQDLQALSGGVEGTQGPRAGKAFGANAQWTGAHWCAGLWVLELSPSLSGGHVTP